MTLLSRKEISDFLAKTAKDKGATIYRIVTDSAKGDTPLKHNQGKAVLAGTTNYTVDTLLSVCRSLGVTISFGVNDTDGVIELKAGDKKAWSKALEDAKTFNGNKSKKVNVNDLSTPSKGKTKDLNEKKTTNYSIDTRQDKADSIRRLKAKK